MHRVLQTLNRVLCVLLFLLFSLGTSGQQLRSTYPVQATVFLRPPYSLYLDDYSNSSTGKVFITLLNRDLMQPESDVRLHIRISGGNQVSLETHPQKQLPVFRLTPGVPYQLSADELGAYFQSGNLQASGSFNGRFPEGMLEVCVTVFEANSGLQLSQTACARAWVSQNRPPLLNIPVNGARYPFKEPQNYLFQWTPRHQGLSQVEYILTLKELHDPNVAPEAAFAFSQEVFSTTVSGRTSYAYTAMDPPLLDNIVYAWQVQAVARDGFSEVNLFENNGYSEIRTFSMAPSCHAPSSVSHRQEGANAVIEWVPAKEGAEQVVSYRSSEGSGDWHHRGTNEHYAYLFDLSPGREYIYKVGTRCSDGSVTYSEEHRFILEDWRKKIEGSCGVLPELNLDTSSSLEFLRAGDVFMAGDFPVTVTIVEGGSNGVFSGSGWTRIPMFMDSKVVVNFKGIRLNALRELVGGYVETSYDINEGQLADLDAITHGRTGTGQTVSGDIWANVQAKFDIPDNPKFKYDDSTGELTVLDEKDQVVGVIKIPEKDKDLFKNKEPFTYVIEDIKGDVYTLTGDGNGGASGGGSISGTQTGTKDTSGKTFNPQKLETRDLVIVFKKSPNSVYTFDTWQDHYKDISLINNKNLYEHLDGYDVPCKLVPPGKTDVVSYELNVVKQGGIDTSKIVFKTGAGIILKHDPEKKELTLNGSNSNDALDIYALYPDAKGDYQLVGKLKVLSYSERSFNLVLVPVNGNRLNESAVSDYLNKDVFNPLGISWNVHQDADFTYPSSDLLSDGSGLFSSYTDEMKALNSAYKSSRGISKNTVYLFILNKGQIGDLNPAGDMPRGKQFGYLFTSNGGDMSWTIAHELGHGLFKLQHTFDKEYGSQAVAQKGKTDNLMDYSGGTHLAKWQWDEIFSPALLVNPFEGDEDAMGTAGGRSGIIIPYDATFVAPNNHHVKLKKGSEIFYMCDYEGNLQRDYLYSFKIDNKTYESKGKIINTGPDGYSFEGYYCGNESYSLEPSFVKIGDEIVVVNQYFSGSYRKLSAKKVRIKELGYPNIGDNVELLSVIEENKIVISKCGEGIDSKGSGTGQSAVVDKANKLDTKRKEALTQKLSDIQQKTGVNWKVYIVDDKTSESDKAKIVQEIKNTKESVAYIEFNGKGEITGNIYGADENGYIPINNDLIQQLITPLRAWEGALGLMLDALSYFIGKAAIPEQYYNPQDANYNDIYSVIFSWSSGTAQAAQSYVAFNCGLWNGLVSTAQSLPDGAKLLNDCSILCLDFFFNKNNARSEITNFFNQFTWEKMEKIVSSIYGDLKGKVMGNPAMQHYYAGRVIFEIVTIYASVAKLGKLTSIMSAIEKFDLFSQVLGKLMKATGVALKFTGKVLNVSAKSGYTFFKILSKSSGNLNFGIPIPDAKQFRKAYETVIEKLRNGSIKVEDIIVTIDGSGEPLLDDLGRKIGYIEEDGEKIVILLDESAENLPGKILDDVNKAGSFFNDLKLGELIGEGGNKNVYEIIGHTDEVVAVLKKGKPISAIDDEIALINTLSENKLPVVDILEKGTFDGQGAIIMKKYSQGSKDIVKRVGDKIEIVGNSTLLNQKSITDLKSIKNTLVNQQIKIDDLQFLISKDGSIVIADPLAVYIGQAPSKWNTQMIDKLIEVASKNVK